MQDAKEEVRSRLAIEDVVGEYVQLKRAGRLWRGLSPFTNEKTPSFFVTPERNIWHDFSANRGGDIFAFIMEVEGLDFRSALEFLARKASVDLSQYSSSGSREFASRKRRFLDANSLAKKYFQAAMVKSKPAQEYIFKKRALSKDTVTEWGIGFAPASGGLADFLRRHDFRDDEIRGAGLMGGRGGDMFRGRMMVPLCDNQGQIVGFTGRIIDAGEPKYINTPATILYDKGRQVFGFHLAKEAIRKQDKAVLVEGNLDVISSHQAGVKNVVACAGTALTVWHLKSLSRLTHNVGLCFDGDKAGVAATERAIILAQELDISLTVIDLPDDAKDPDELIQQNPKLWQKAVAGGKPAVQWVIDHYAGQVDLTGADGKKKLTNEALKLIGHLDDPVEVEHYLKVLAKLIDAEVATLQCKLAGQDASAEHAKPALKPTKVEKLSAVHRRTENALAERILAVALMQKNLRSVLNNLPNEYLTEPLAKVKYYLLSEKSVEIDTGLADKLAELELISTRIDGDKRTLMLAHMKELELIEIEKRRAKMLGEFSSTDDDEKKREIINGAIKGLNQTVKTLRTTGPNDEFAGLFQVWDARKENGVV
ncbi:MAG: DNA primase [Candidatus Nomurabacteria bacterium]|jgi:DNA primase|nr:DNA primase [Candidatus Nomurabacteria bacterium]